MNFQNMTAQVAVLQAELRCTARCGNPHLSSAVFHRPEGVSRGGDNSILVFVVPSEDYGCHFSASTVTVRLLIHGGYLQQALITAKPPRLDATVVLAFYVTSFALLH